MIQDTNFYISGYSVDDIYDIDEEAIEEKRIGGVRAYDIYNFINSFNTDDFESMFYMSYEIIKDYPLDDLIIMTRYFIDMIFEKYEYQIIPSPVFRNIDDINEFLNFIKFLKFDNITFLFDLLSELDINISNIIHFNNFNGIDDISIINQVEKISFKYKHNEYIYNYLISQSKDPFIKWLNEIYIRNKSEIILEMTI